MSFVRWICSLSLCLLAGCSTGAAPLGPAGAPVVAQVLEQPVRASTAEEMAHLILRALTDRFAAERGIVVSQAEVDAYVARQRQVLAADPKVSATQDSLADRAAREQGARAYLLQRKIDGALQRLYGGRIALRSGGAVPVDAYRRFLEDQAALGRFRILDAANLHAFWRPYTDDSTYQFAAPDSEQARRAFELPPGLP